MCEQKYDQENVWIGWNGGGCPVHPETEVEGILRSSEIKTASAKNWGWEHFGGSGDIIAFRITRLYREPRKAREWWVNRYYGSPSDDTLFASRAEADSAALDENRIECIHVREVLGDDDAH